jgi:hypothetical protein
MRGSQAVVCIVIPLHELAFLSVFRRIGQRVLSLVKEGHRYYWPGTIKDVFLRERVGTAVQYKVEFWDGKITNVPRQCLLTPDDPEFFTCQVRWLVPGDCPVCHTVLVIRFELILRHADGASTGLR